MCDYHSTSNLAKAAYLYVRPGATLNAPKLKRK